MIGPLALLTVDRWSEYLVLFGLWGACGFLALLVPPALAHDIGRRFRGVCAAAVAAAVVAAALRLPLEAAMIGNGWPDSLDPVVVWSVLFETSVGRAWQAQAAAAVLLLFAGVLRSKLRISALAVTAGLGLAAQSLTGHAAMHEGVIGAGHRANDILHLLSGGAWFGALIPLPTILDELRPGRRKAEASVALRRFSRAGHAAVAVVIATGVVNAGLILGQCPLARSPYSVLLAIKICLVVLMTGLAVFNRYGLVPRLSTSLTDSLRRLRRLTLVEVGLGAAVLGLVAAFGLLEPD